MKKSILTLVIGLGLFVSDVHALDITLTAEQLHSLSSVCLDFTDKWRGRALKRTLGGLSIVQLAIKHPSSFVASGAGRFFVFIENELKINTALPSIFDSIASRGVKI